MRMRSPLLRILPVLGLAALALPLMFTGRAGGRPAETAVGGPAGAPNLTQDITRKLIAQWPLLTAAGSTNVRYYCIDYDSGIDTRAGYTEAAAGSTLTTCSGAAVKTLSRFRAIFPSNGNGRSAAVLIKARASGATYRNVGNTADEGLDLSQVSGYAYLLVRGSTDLTNSAADRLLLGAQKAVSGPNGDGSYTVTAGATTSVFSVAAGSLGSADTAVGWRARFDAATSTVALRNVSAFIAVNSTTQVTTGANLGAAPSNTDTFFVEQPGVRIASFVEPYTQRVQVAGLAITATTVSSFQVTGNGSGHAFIELTGATTNATLNVASNYTAVGGITFSSAYTDEAAGFTSVGSALRSVGGMSIFAPSAQLSVSSTAFTSTTASVSVTSLGMSFGGVGSYFAKGPTLNVVAGIGGGSGSSGILGPTSVSTQRAARFPLGPLTIAGNWQVLNLDVSNSATAGIVVNPGIRQGSYIFMDSVTGTGNATVGLDLFSFTRHTQVACSGTTITITGAAGNIKLSGGPIATWADLALTNVWDAEGNHVYTISPGTAAQAAQVGQAQMVSNQSGGALAVGNLVKSNGTTGQVTTGKADTSAANAHVECVMVTAPASAALGLCAPPGGVVYMLFDGAPTVGAIAYLSVGTTAKATTTVPPVAGTNQKIRLGRVLAVTGNTGYVAFAPDWLAVAADGNP